MGKRFTRVSRENPVPHAAPEVTVTLVLMWPVYQSEMNISVRCQGNANGGRLGQEPSAGLAGPAGPSFPILQHKGASEDSSDKRSIGKCQLSDPMLLLA